MITSVATSTFYREPAPDRDAVLRKRLREIWKPNMGYRFAHSLLKNEFSPLNIKRVHRLWKEEKLTRKKQYRKRRTGNPMPFSASKPNEVWCLDFCHDSCLNGTKIKVLAVIDEFTRECLALDAGTTFNSAKVQRVLAGLFASRCAPEYLRSDNGSEFIARSLAAYLSKSGTNSRFTKPGSPWQNGCAESFIATLRRDCLDVEVFHNLTDAQVRLSIYRRYYNDERPHSSLGYRPPATAMSESTPEEVYS